MNKKSKWKNSRKDGFPCHKQEVLLSVDGINYHAVFDAIEKRFEPKVKSIEFLFDANTLVYWME